MILNRFNFTAWKEDIEDRCLMKNRTEENVKIAFLRSGLTTADKNELRAAMQAENEREANKKKKYGNVDLESKPYTWALHYIEEVILRGGSTAEELEQKCEKIKAQLLTLRVSEFGYDLARYHNRFHSMVEEINAIGQRVPQDVLAMYYQEGMRPHRDLRHLTVDKKRREDKTYRDLYREYVEALDGLKPMKKGRPVAAETTGKTHQNKGFRGECHACGKTGHRANKCWNKNPELKPEWLKKKEATAAAKRSGQE